MFRGERIYIKAGKLVYRRVADGGDNVLDAIDTLMPCFFTSTINGCQNFEIWLEIVVSNETISYNEADNRYKQFKMSSAYDWVQSIKQACENNGVKIQQPNEIDFSFDY
ncbi:uncharacterized protein OCT59_019336 [Rhizophagus irregularis]|uniref:Uncharacterized protein n=1 Tax=Rhizophagus irregularis (strain DAOM 197198w) TaxID=1432141 RepID=A0A015KWL8_RHIIW|nr:hypothetical protein RirG_142980 [Rhizophagus irregularis DAOM 197198w]UZO27130.1 hypothetical protein OCT59_019336 [Rhizophagus irregularis]GBC33702.1 hypothetical protein GLOIN_2v1781472 [Rhizophagus irregularis DAOM 181602=DAOM 197198]